MGRFLQSGWPSILVSTSLKAGFLDLQERTEGDWVFRNSETPWFKVSEQSRWIKSMRDMIRTYVCVCLLGHSHQLLQGSLLIDLIGAVRDIGIKVRLGMLANNVADVIDHYVLLVSFLQLLEEPEQRMNKGLVSQGFIQYMATA